MPTPGVLQHNPDMTLAPGASEAVQVFTVDDDGEIDGRLGAGMRVADDVVLVLGRPAARLTEATGRKKSRFDFRFRFWFWKKKDRRTGRGALPPRLRVALPLPDRSNAVTFVDVETVHVAEPGKVAQFHELIAADPDTAVVALELVDGPEITPLHGASRAAAWGPGDGPPVLMSTNVLCLLFGRLLRICRR